MNFFLFLGALVTLCQCGGTPTAPPAPPPREGPKCHNVWMEGTCDLAYAERGWWDVYLSTPQDMFNKATNEAECTQACQIRANTYGYGCCQWGEFWGKDKGTRCRFASGRPFAKKPTPSLYPMVGMNKVSHCSECASDSYRMGWPQNCDLKSTKSSVSGFRPDGLSAAAFAQSVSEHNELMYVFAAIGLAFVLYGGYGVVKKLM